MEVQLPVRYSVLCLLTVGVLLSMGLYNCEESSNTILQHEFDSSCLSCHTDQSALEKLAESEDHGDGHESGEG